MNLTVNDLKNIAKEVNLTGVSKLRKAELESVVFKLREGRMAFYRLRDDKFAEEAVSIAIETGSFTLDRPIPKVAPANWNREYLSPEEKENYRAKAEFVGKIRAIKSIIFENNMRHVRFHENEAGFHLQVVKKEAA